MIRKFSLFFALIPIWLFIVLLFLLNYPIYLVSALYNKIFEKKNNNSNIPLRENASIVVLNWNGRALLEECLPSVIEAVRYDGNDHEILVVDNGSTDDSVNFIRDNFPEVKLVCLDKNYQFIGGNNLGIKEAKNDILVFLNNDMKVKKDFLRPLLDGFHDETVFAVSSQIFFFDQAKRREETGKTRTSWNKGMIEYRHDQPNESDINNKYIPVFWLGGDRQL
jgi:GT2 family glycosyltransferase